MHQYTIQQTLLTRNGVDELLLAKRTYPNGSHTYVLAYLGNAAHSNYVAIPVSQKRVEEIRAGLMTLRNAFVHGETAVWYRCGKIAEGLESGAHQETDI